MAVALAATLGSLAGPSQATAEYQVNDRLPLFSPDGRTLAFVLYGVNPGRIELIGADGRGLRALTPTQPVPSGLTWLWTDRRSST